jgi:catechol 2,3-dioxygenase-like lactoylglutathione lyase family enzyme
MIEWVSHITFIVKNMEKTAKMFKSIFWAEEVYSWENAKYFLIANQWIALNPWNSLKEKTYNHLAFKVSKEEFQKCKKLVENFWIEVKEWRKRRDWEADSIYFYDYDNHLFEIHSWTLEERLRSYTGEFK